MSATQYFDELIAAHITPLAGRRRWTTVRDDKSSRGSLRDYVAGNIYIRVTSDRGLFEIEIGSCPDNLRSVSFYKDLLSPPAAGRWNLSVEQACEFIDSQWSWFLEHFSQDKVTETLQNLDANARRNA